MKKNNYNKEIWEAIDRSTILVSLLMIVLMCIFYFYILESVWLEVNVKTFLLDIITNIIPVFVVFIFSYFLIRKFQKLRANVEKDTLLDEIEKKINETQNPRLENVERELEKINQNLNEVNKSIEKNNNQIEKLWDKLPILNPESLQMVGSFFKNNLKDPPRLPQTIESSKTGQNLALLEGGEDDDE